VAANLVEESNIQECCLESLIVFHLGVDEILGYQELVGLKCWVKEIVEYSSPVFLLLRQGCWRLRSLGREVGDVGDVVDSAGFVEERMSEAQYLISKRVTWRQLQM
jgi:hypothetical protein